MGTYLITGVAGTGKSTVTQELTARGYTAIDTAAGQNCFWVDQTTGQLVTRKPTTPERQGINFEWVWDELWLTPLLTTPPVDPLFISGIAANQAKFYPRFTAIFVLTADSDALTRRLLGRTTNDFGKRPGEIEGVVARYETFTTAAQRAGAITIDSTQPVAQVVNTLLRYVEAHA